MDLKNIKSGALHLLLLLSPGDAEAASQFGKKDEIKLFVKTRMNFKGMSRAIMHATLNDGFQRSHRPRLHLNG